MPPERTAKRGGAGGPAGADDRLSALPEGLLHAILSFLPAPQVVQTSVLSRRWVDLWRSTPCVNIDELVFKTDVRGDLQERKEKRRRFEDFTNNLLLFRNNVASLDRFRIFTNELHRRDLDRWVRRGIKYCPQVLEIHIGYLAAAVPFPHMGASSCRLKRLHLVGVCLDSRFAELLSSGCPVLEDLELRSCSKGFQEITSRTLKKLVIYSCDNLTGDPVVIRAAHLVYLQLVISYGCYSSGISVYETASLVKASIRLLCFGETFSLKNQRWLLGNLWNVTNLELSDFNTTVVLIKESDDFPIFPNMQALSLTHCFLDEYDLNDKLEALGSFLQNSPFLEKLTLQCYMFQVDSGTEGQLVRKNIILQRQVLNTFQCQKLKSIEVMYEEDHDHQLVELLWGIGRRLPDASIILTNLFVD